MPTENQGEAGFAGVAIVDVTIIRSRLDLPLPLEPMTPILAPG